MKHELEKLTIQVSPRAAEAYRTMVGQRRALCDQVMNRWLENEAKEIDECARRIAEPDRPGEAWDVVVPIDLKNPDSPSVRATGAFDPVESWLADENGLRAMNPWISLSKEDAAKVRWLLEAELLLVRLDQKQKLARVVGQTTRDEARRYRVPLWVQSKEAPECCGMFMNFVGQIDDETLCEHAPPGAVLWWHDAASFFVFTCSVCLGVKAVGQQY